MRNFFLLGLISVPSLVFAGVGECLTSAYPEIKSVTDGTVYFSNGKNLPIGSVSTKSFTQTIDYASIADQLSQKYSVGFHIPKKYEDAGRLRNDDFFKNLYGDNEAKVRNNLTTILWKPSNTKIQFNARNNAAKQLKATGDEIAQNPDLVSYVSKSLGSFNYRKIAGTNRLSNHSFGIAVDFQLPKHLHKYWRWDGCTSEDKVCPFPTQLMNDAKLQQLVRIFEKHGFIWGGKWASYDSVHFEYRPELLIAQCR